jgi:hypothetical protein
MTYNDFTLDTVRKVLGLIIRQEQLFAKIVPLEVPQWLKEALAKGMPLALSSEKARAEFLVVPILLTSRELSNSSFSIYSGQRLDVDPEQGLVDECDFILTYTPPLPVIQAPIMIIVEAKKNDVESGLGQCAAQMLGAKLFNQKEGNDIETIFGCVTTGEAWQFLKLAHNTVSIDLSRYYINHVGQILEMFQAIISYFQSYHPATSQPTM